MPVYHPNTNKYYCGTPNCNEDSGIQCPRCSVERLRYCGRRFCDPGQCPCGSCDGKCGPTNGCCCPRCHLLNFGTPQVSTLRNSNSNSNNQQQPSASASASSSSTRRNNSNNNTSTTTTTTTNVDRNAPTVVPQRITRPSVAVRPSNSNQQQQQQQQQSSGGSVDKSNNNAATRGAKIFIPFEYDPIIG